MDIKINKEHALKVLNKNRGNHIDEYAQQIKGWKKAMEKYNKELASWSTETSANIFDIDSKKIKPIEPTKPRNYLDSYDRFIELISANVTDIIEISEYEYDQIIKNQFNWTQGFISNSALYSSI